MTENVLVVDPSLTVRMNLAEAFGAAGFRALPCAGASQAWQLLRAERIDLALVDESLPEREREDLLGLLRSERHPLPIIVLGREAHASALTGLDGADAYITKPYELGDVLAKARHLLRGRRAPSPPNPVLVIDDSATFRAELQRVLTEDGHVVVTADSGEEGLRLLATLQPAAVIVDGILPGIDGATVIRRIRLDSGLRRVPCLLLTAEQAASAELRALDSGADAFIRKDDDLAVIRLRLHALLRQAGEASEVPDSLLGPKQILAVDDSPTYRTALARTLRSEGYDVLIAESGEKALELLAAQSVDCILLDLMMPGIGGKETCRRLKGSPIVRDIPVIVLTSVEGREAMLEGLALGADDYIQKSTEFEVLKARVRAQLRRRQVEHETRKVRERLLRSELEAREARAAREIAESRAVLVEELAAKNRELHGAYRELQTAQSTLVQTAKMASLGELVAGVAHEINNPLAFALAHLGTARLSLQRVRSGLTDEWSEEVSQQWQRAEVRLSEMGVGLERIRELVVKLRTFSRLDEGELKYASVRECVESLLTILQYRLGQVQVETHFEGPEQIECYPGLLNQALMNLVSNAIDAIEGAGTIRIQAGAEGNDYMIAVTDTGPGIPEHLRERVIEPFFTTKPVGQGTGLGLSITYSIIRKHGGSLELLDGPSGGTRALIHLPLEVGAATRASND